MPDIDANFLYATVGRALCAWETLEAHLSYLYSICVDHPMQIEALQEYGREAMTFPARITTLKKAGKRYFQKHPSQSNEGDMCSLIKEASTLVKTRNQIAHGIVYSMTSFSKGTDGVDRFVPGFAMVPSWHAAFHIKGDDYLYTAAAVMRFTEDFIKLAERVAELTGTLNPTIKIEVELC